MVNSNLFAQHRHRVSLLAIVLALGACSNQPTMNRSTPLTAYEQVQRHSFLDFYQEWQGVPYRLGGMSFNGIDCSALVKLAYQDTASVTLPRTTALQSNIGIEVDYNNAKVGDLFFFKTSLTSRHVGIYLGNKQFMHASTSKGVMLSRIDNPYWADVFWQVRRVNTRL
ncbi:NlpC/P60 family protein [Vibrio kasasachensis]|uniref:C40 family peptidase n=1 Tax=Vibrio kasasachensis TaxID=2910248 RepID=UPI003D0AF4CF